MASLVSPIKPVSVPVQIEWQDTVISGEELGISWDAASKLQHVDVGDSSIYKPWIFGNKINIIYVLYELKKKVIKKTSVKIFNTFLIQESGTLIKKTKLEQDQVQFI